GASSGCSARCQTSLISPRAITFHRPHPEEAHALACAVSKGGGGRLMVRDAAHRNHLRSLACYSAAPHHEAEDHRARSSPCGSARPAAIVATSNQKQGGLPWLRSACKPPCPEFAPRSSWWPEFPPRSPTIPITRASRSRC